MDDGITRNHCLNLEALQKNQMPESWIMKLQLLNKQWLSCVWGLNCVGLPGLSFCLLFFFVLFTDLVKRSKGFSFFAYFLNFK